MGDDRKICSISLSYELVCDGLIGGKYEYKPYIGWHTSFGAYRMKEIDPLTHIRDLETPTLQKSEEIAMSNKIGVYRSAKPIDIELLDYDEMKGDATIHFKLFTHTRYSGVDSIDKSESKYVERELSDGYVQLTLKNLFDFYKQDCLKAKLPTLNTKKAKFQVTDTFDDQKVIDEKAHDLLRKMDNARLNTVMDKVVSLCKKASITFTIKLRNFSQAAYERSIFNVPDLTTNHLHSLLPLNKRRQTKSLNASSKAILPLHTQQNRDFEPLLFNSTKSWHHWMQTMNNCLGKYIEHFLEIDEMDAKPLYKPAEEAISNLQFPIYASEMGKMPVFAYWVHDPFYRTYASQAERAKDIQLYGLNEKTEQYFLLLLRSGLRRFGLKEQTLIDEIETHFSPDNLSTQVSPNFLRVEQAIAHVGTFAANSAYYTADFRFMPETTGLKGHASTHNGGIGELRQCAKCGKEIKMRVLSLDSWDNHILNNTTKCDDCEGQDNTATSILRSFAIGRAELGFNWTSKALQCVKKLLDHSVLYDTAALVTSAFMDTNNKKIEKKQEDLPLIGSQLDKDAQNDGHCFPLQQAMTICLEMLEAGNAPKDAIEKVREASSISSNPIKERAFRQRDKQRSILVLEPTGSIEARILSIEESYNSQACNDPENRLYAKMKAMVYFMRQIRQDLKEYDKEMKELDEDDEANNGISELFVGEGLPHYVNRQVPQRRVSSFYNSVVHGTSVDLMRFDPTLSQFAFCMGDKYGVRMGNLMRDSSQGKVSLICPYADYKEKWLKDVVPMIESIQNQMPIMRFGRYTDKQYKEEIYSRFIPRDEMKVSLSLAQTDERKAKQAKFEKLLEEVDSLDSDKTIVRLYSRLWKLKQKAEKTERLNQFLSKLPGLVDYAFYVEKHLPVCEPIVEILCIVNVGQCLALPLDVK